MQRSANWWPRGRIAGKVRNTHIIFNNCDEDKGQRNDITFMKMLLAS